MAISEHMRVARNEMFLFLAERTADPLAKLGPEIARELRMTVADLLRDYMALQRAETDDECLAAMRTAAIMLRFDRGRHG